MTSERSDDVVRDRDRARSAEAPMRATASEAPERIVPEPRRRGWQQVLGLVVAAAALMLAVAGVIGVVAGSLARAADGDGTAEVLAFVAQGVALVLGSLVVGLGVLWLLVRGERRRAASSSDERASST